MERTRDEDDRPLEPRDWEETRGEHQQEPHDDPHEQPTAAESEQAYHDEPGGPGSPEAMERQPEMELTAAATADPLRAGRPRAEPLRARRRGPAAPAR
jgi:hypothetical protein